jgi:uncharacterized protein (TIGR00297 family)
VDRILNYLFTFFLIVIFVFAANPVQRGDVFLGLILSTFFAFISFLAKRLSLDGMYSTIAVGTFIFGLGGWPAAVVILVFFISSTVITGRWDIPYEEWPVEARRNGLQVWANGFWIVLCLGIYALFEADIFLIGALASIATATADTWATELGSKNNEATYLITNFKAVKAGTDGGVSTNGTLASLIGSAIIASVSVYVFSLHFSTFLYIFIAGFVGCIVDSFAGALLQRHHKTVNLPFTDISMAMDNNVVNGISNGFGALLSIILKLIFT